MTRSVVFPEETTVGPRRNGPFPKHLPTQKKSSVRLFYDLVISSPCDDSIGSSKNREKEECNFFVFFSKKKKNDFVDVTDSIRNTRIRAVSFYELLILISFNRA